jgi:hypothetical protein
MSRSTLSALVLSLVVALSVVAVPAAAKTKRVARSPAATAQNCDGTPIIMQGLPCPSGAARSVPDTRVERLPRIPRGSSGYIPPVPAPSPPSLALPRAPTGPYFPPPLNTFSDRVMQCNQSFTFNAGIGNNPTNRDAYVRQCAN